jgi:colanic acid/amylovoran biosynthesis protein
LTLIKAIYHYRKRGLTPIFLNHEGLADAQLISMVNSKLEDPISVVEESDPLVIKGIIASATAVFCSRYHGCVSALSSGIPCVGTSWSHKYEALYEDYGMSKFLLGSDVDQSHLQRVIDDSLSLTDQTKKELLEKVEIQKRDSLLMWEEIIFLVKNYYENIAQ